MKIGSNLENLTQISSNQTNPVSSGVNGGTAAASPAAAQSLGADSAQVSRAAGQVAQSELGSDVRLDKVASIQSALAAGTYTVPASAVASKLVDSMLSGGK